MELIKGISQTIKVSLPSSASTISAQVTSEEGTPIGGSFTPTFNAGLCTITVPYSVVITEGVRKVVVTFSVDGEVYTRSVAFHVSTSYLELWELKEILEDEGETDEQCWAVESAVRNIINAHTGQSFGYANKTLTFVGDGGTALSLPERLIKLNALSEGGNVKYDRANVFNQETFLGDGQYVVTGSGWFLKKPAWSDVSWNGSYTSRDPIVAPRSNRRTYSNDVEYSLTGSWGYEQVPDEVREAAKLLVNDYACGEQIYRDRFLSAIKASDWNLSYYSAAYYKTGNARADLLLSPYVVNRMKVI